MDKDEIRCWPPLRSCLQARQAPAARHEPFRMVSPPAFRARAAFSPPSGALPGGSIAEIGIGIGIAAA